MSAEADPVLPAGIGVVSRGPAPDPAIVDDSGMLRPQCLGGRAEGILPGEGADRPADGRVAPPTGSKS